MRLTDREFPGQIIEGEDPKNRGRYCVLVPELMYNIYDKEEGYIYCVNQTHNTRNSSSDQGIYGQYFPLHPGTKVIVKFFAEDKESGYIDRVISDYYENSMPLGIPTIDRDQYYQILRTIANDLVAVTHETSEIPKNGIHIYHKEDQTQIVIDETGIHIYTKKHFDQRIDGKAFIKIDDKVDCIIGSETNIQITGATKVNLDNTLDVTIKSNNKIKIEGNSDINITGDGKITTNGICYIKATGDCNIESSGMCNIKSGSTCSISASGVCNIKSGGMCNIDGSKVNINCGIATEANSASTAATATKSNIVVDPKAPLIPLDEKQEISDDFI